MATRLWIEKYRPTTLYELDYHQSLSQLLERLASHNDIPHILFYGPQGAGKKTRTLTFLHEIFGGRVNKTRCEVRSFKVGSSVVEVSIISSNYHIDITPSDCGFKDKIIVQQAIKEIGSSRNPDGRAFKCLILNQAHLLSNEAQAALRRTLEKCTSTTRIILLCASLCKVIPPLRSRCLCIRVPAPKYTDIASVLSKISTSENIPLPHEFMHKLIKASGRNLRRAIMMFQSAVVQNGNLNAQTVLPHPEWERYLGEIAKNVIDEQTPKRLKSVRGKIYEVLANCIPPTAIFHSLCRELTVQCDDRMKAEVYKWAANYEHQMQFGTKPIVHIEAFLARFMNMYRQYLTQLMAY